MRVIFGIVDQHDGERGARPIAIPFLPPYPAELRDDAPITRGRSAAAFAHHLAALNRHQDVPEREELQLQPGENPCIAALNQRLLEHRVGSHRDWPGLEHTGEFGRRKRVFSGRKGGVLNRSLEGARGLEGLRDKRPAARAEVRRQPPSRTTGLGLWSFANAWGEPPEFSKLS